ncbi:MAG: hypothetical protein Q7R93_05715 [bacterium]|nr:hypothetical protein [bacterium]
MKSHFTPEQQQKIDQRAADEKAEEQAMEARRRKNISELAREATRRLKCFPELRGQKALLQKVAAQMAVFAQEKRFQAAAAFLR